MKNKKVSTIKSTFISQPLLNEKLFSKLTNSNRNKNSNLLNKNKIITDSNWNINISRAYSILSDESKRKRYDKYGIVDEDNFLILKILWIILLLILMTSLILIWKIF